MDAERFVSKRMTGLQYFHQGEKYINNKKLDGEETYADLFLDCLKVFFVDKISKNLHCLFIMFIVYCVCVLT